MLQKNWKELIKPQKLDVEPGDDAKREATVVAEPLERGFGLTLGNALRRVLLSSLQGAAVTSIKIDNVLHEFSSIPGAREDVVDIVLNIKAMAVKMQGDRPQRLYLRAVKEGDFNAAKALGDIYAEGKGDVGKDYADSLRYYQLAEKNGVEVPRARAR